MMSEFSDNQLLIIEYLIIEEPRVLTLGSQQVLSIVSFAYISVGLKKVPHLHLMYNPVLPTLATGLIPS